MFNSFLNVLSRLSFAKAQGRKRVVSGLKTVLERDYLIPVTSGASHITIEF
ncbi:MAG: hypothetical protein LBJ79_02010 [Endomicrobium sp.]|nr:hypothetical protein [Endomicrobium sp.]